MLVRAKVDVSIPGSGDILNVGDAPRSVPAALALYMCIQGLVTLEGYEDEIMSLVQASGDPVQQGGVGDKAKTIDYGRRYGEDKDADMLWGGPRCEPYVVNATGQVITGPCWVYAVRTNTIGTSSTLDLYDGTSTGGTPVFESVPTGTINVAGYRSPIAAEGLAVFCANGLYASKGGTGSPEWTVFALAAQPA